MKILIAPNYFKGSLSAVKIVEIIENKINNFDKGLISIKCPLADGGDGTIDSIRTAIGGELQKATVHDPLFRQIEAEWLKLDNNTAVIEAAKANGLSLLSQHELNPFITTSYGVGELINATLNSGCRKIIIGVGGSATNDGGYGALKALGIRFLDKNHNEISNDIRSFNELAFIDTSKINPLVKEAEILVATDVKNPLTGKDGASCTYARQKGAKEEDIETLDRLLLNFAQVCQKVFNKDLSNISGSGAAGGLAYGLSEIANAKIVDGFNTISGLIGLNEKIKNSDIVLTGEGRLDKQSLWGKAPIKVAELAKKYNKPCIAIIGSLEENINFESYFDDIYCLADKNISIQEAISNADELLGVRINEVLSEIIKQKK